MSRLITRLGRVASGDQAPLAFSASFPVTWRTSKSLLIADATSEPLPDPLAINGIPVPQATEDEPYAGFQVTASGGVPPYTFDLIGNWPDGLTADPVDAETVGISGTPTEHGIFDNLIVRVTDNESNTADLGPFTIEIAEATEPPEEADISVAITQFLGPTSNGLHEVTITDLGWTPKSAIFLYGGGSTLGTWRGSAQFNFGVIGGDGNGGLAEFAVANLHRDNIGSATLANTVRHGQRDDRCLMLNSNNTQNHAASGVGDGSAGNPGPIPNGWRLNWSGASSGTSDRWITVVFFGGADFDSHVGQFNHGPDEDDTTQIRGLGFRPSAIFFSGHSYDSANLDNDSGDHHTFGISYEDGETIRNFAYGGVGTSSGGTHGRSIGLYNVCCSFRASAGDVIYRAEITAFDNDGFDWTLRDDDSEARSFYLALNLAGRPFWADIIPGPQSASADWEVTAPGFEPVLIGLCATNIESISEDAGADAIPYRAAKETESVALAISDGESAYCNTFLVNDGASSTPLAWSLARDDFLRLSSGNQNTEVDIDDAPEFTEDGWKVDASQINAINPDALFLAWAIGAEGGHAGGGNGGPNGNGDPGNGEPEGDILYVAPRWTQASKGAPIIEETNGDGASPASPIRGPERIADVVSLQETDLNIVYLLGHYIPFNVGANDCQIALRSGGGEESRNKWWHKHEGQQVTLWGGIVIDGSVTDHGDGTFTLNGALRSNISFPWFADVGFGGPDNEGVLMRRVFSVEELQADDQYTYYFPGSVATAQSVRVHLPNGENPRYRIMQGGYGYRYNFGGPANTSAYLDFHDFKYRVTSWNTNDPPPTKTRWFGLTDIKWSRGSSQYALFPMHQSQGGGNGQRAEDLYFEHVRLEEGRNGLYFVSLQNRGFHGVMVDKIEGYNIANRPQYESSDGHVFACEDHGGFNQVTIGEVISRNTGLPIAVHLSAGQETSSCHDFNLVGPVDLQGIGAHVVNSGANLGGIGLYGGNAVEAGKWSNVRILTDPTKVSVLKDLYYGFRVHWYDPNEPVLIGYQGADLTEKHILIDDMTNDFPSSSVPADNRGGIRAARSHFNASLGFNESCAIRVRNVEFGPNCYRAISFIGSGIQHGTGLLIESDWNKFHAEASQQFFRSPQFGDQTFAGWQGNEAGDNVYDPGSVRVDP